MVSVFLFASKSLLLYKAKKWHMYVWCKIKYIFSRKLLNVILAKLVGIYPPPGELAWCQWPTWKSPKSAAGHRNPLQKFVLIFKSVSKDTALPCVATEGPFTSVCGHDFSFRSNEFPSSFTFSLEIFFCSPRKPWMCWLH